MKYISKTKKFFFPFQGNSEEGRQLVSTLHSGIADLIQVVRSSLSQQVSWHFTVAIISIPVLNEKH